jgi:hypothetical protein
MSQIGLATKFPLHAHVRPQFLECTSGNQRRIFCLRGKCLNIAYSTFRGLCQCDYVRSRELSTYQRFNV